MLLLLLLLPAQGRASDESLGASPTSLDGDSWFRSSRWSLLQSSTTDWPAIDPFEPLATDRRSGPGHPLAKVGAVPERAPVGHGAGGLQRQRRRLELLHPRPGALSRAYHWGEDGRDPILKDRLFGLTNAEGNHGEDVKEYYFYLDSTPTHSYMKWLYKYPQAFYMALMLDYPRDEKPTTVPFDLNWIARRNEGEKNAE